MPDDRQSIVNSSLKSITAGASLYFIGKITSNGIGFLFNLVLTRSLGATLYGVYAYAMTLISLAIIFSRVGTGKSVLKFIPEYENDPERQQKMVGLAYLTALVGSTVSGVGLYFFAPTITAYTLDNSLLTDVLRIFAVVLPFKSVLALTNAIFRGQERMELQVITDNIARPVFELLVVLIAILLGYSLLGVVYALAIGSILLAAFAISLLLAKTEIYPQIVASRTKSDIHRFYNYSVPLTLKDVGQYLYKRVDVLMVGFFLLEADVGIYQIAILIAGFLTLPLSGFNQLFPPVASRLYSNDNMNGLNQIYKKITRWALTISLIPGLIILIYAEEILSVFGNEFIAGASVLILFTIAQLTNCAVGPSGYLLMMTEHQYLNLLNQWTLGVLNVILNYIFIMQYGLIGAALATASVLVFINLLRLVEVWYTERMFPYSVEYWKPLATGLLSGLVMYSFSIYFEGLLSLFFGAAAGTTIFIGCLLLFGIETEDRDFLKSLVN